MAGRKKKNDAKMLPTPEFEKFCFFTIFRRKKKTTYLWLGISKKDTRQIVFIIERYFLYQIELTL
jgi:hypothetical protein